MTELKMPRKLFDQVVLPHLRRRPLLRSRAKTRNDTEPSTQNRVLVRIKMLTEFLSVGRTLTFNLTLLFVSCAFGWMLVKAVRSTSITVRPIPVPEALSKRGYTPEVFAARVAAEMVRIDREAITAMPRQRIGRSEDQPDIQIPGQPFSFRTFVKYTKELVGIDDIAVSIDVTEEKGDHIAQIRTVGGPYDGSLETASSPIADNTDALVLKVAKAAMHAAEPGVLASYEVAVEEARCGQSSSCEFAEALALYKEILTKPPLQDDKWALLGQGYVLERLKRYEELLESSQKAAQLDPKLALAFNNWGFALLDLGRSEEAMEKYQRATELDPKSADAFNNWGIALQNLGRNEGAMEKYQRATELDPKLALAFNNWGRLLESLGRQKEADEKYKLARNAS